MIRLSHPAIGGLAKRYGSPCRRTGGAVAEKAREMNMRRSIAIVLAALAGLSIWETASAEGRTIAIEIKGATLMTPITISDADIVSRFNVWNGPGVRVNGRPDYLDPDKESGRFIDWPKGTVGEHRTGALRSNVPRGL
jgi:hypothetical protein